MVRLALDGYYLSEYESIKDATEELGIHYACISEVCTGKQKTAGGYKWMYKEDYQKRLNM